MKFISSLTASALILLITVIAKADERTLAYDILRNGHVIGAHTVTIAEDGPDTHVHIETHIKIESFFITEYAYDFSSDEDWRDGQLIALHSTSSEDGERRTVSVQLDGARYTVNSVIDKLDRLQRIPATAHPTSSWTPTVTRHDQLFDTSTGVALDVTVLEKESNQFVISGEWTRTLTYDDTGTLVEMRFPDRTKTAVIFKLK